MRRLDFSALSSTRPILLRALLLLAALVGHGAMAQSQLPGPILHPIQPSPIPLVPLLPVLRPEDLTEITSGANHSCVVRRDGTVWCWGNNGSGEVGIGTWRADVCGSFSCALQPTRLTQDLNGATFTAAHVSAGWDHTCALDLLGNAFCWGVNTSSQAGVPYLAQVWQPLPAGGGRRYNALSAGNQTTCAVDASAVWCWGLMNDGTPGSFSLNGDQSVSVAKRTWSPLPIQPSSANRRSVSVGYMHVCTQSNVYGFNEITCIGRNSFGELGYDPALGHAFVLFGSSFGRPVGPAATNVSYTCADRLNDGTVVCAGQNVNGVLGNGNYVNTGTAQVVGNGMQLSGVTAGWQHACAIDPQLRAWCWGSNTSGQLGNGTRTRSNLPVLVGGGSVKFRQLAAGLSHTCGIATTNNIYCWGGNDAGQLGRGYGGGSDTLPQPAAALRM